MKSQVRLASQKRRGRMFWNDKTLILMKSGEAKLLARFDPSVASFC
jgi:hypothetical protein